MKSVIIVSIAGCLLNFVTSMPTGKNQTTAVEDVLGLSGANCFTEQLKNSSSNQIFVCNSDGILSDDEVEKLKRLELEFPADSECGARIFVSLENSSKESNLVAETGFVCETPCCDTIAIAYCAHDDHIFYTQNVSGNSIQACRIQRIIQQSNIIPASGNASTVASRVHDVVSQLTAEFQNPLPAEICADYKIDNDEVLVAEHVSKAPLIITIVLGILIGLLVIAFIAVCIWVCLARRGGAGGKASAFLFRQGKGETLEAQPLEEEGEENATKNENDATVVVVNGSDVASAENDKNAKLDKIESAPLTHSDDESLVRAVYNATTTTDAV